MKEDKKNREDTSKPNADTYVQTAHEQAMRGDTKGAQDSMNYGIKDSVTESGVDAIRAMHAAVANERDDKKRKIMAEAIREKDTYNVPEDVKAAAERTKRNK